MRVRATGCVRLTHIDGKLPNLALMKIAQTHRDRALWAKMAEP